jgi:HSP20 family protein
MARRSRGKQNSESHRSRAQQPQHARERTVAVLHEAAKNANPYQPIERFMQAFTPFGWLQPWMAMPPSGPKLDVIDRDASVLVRAEVPGVHKSNLAVEASDVAVTIKGEVQQAETREDERYRISETSRGAFERTVRLPTEVDSTKAKATFKDGVIEVTLPKIDRSRAHQVKF